jgi:hypothetical protein
MKSSDIIFMVERIRNEELHNLHSPILIVKVISSVRLRRMGDVLPVRVLMVDGDEVWRNELLLRADLAHTAER